MNRKEYYAERALRLRRRLEHLNDPLARIVLAALADAMDEAAAEPVRLAGQNPSPDSDS
jgi:hypothetical protein